MTKATSPERSLAAQLLSIGAVSFSPKDPYTWASGLRSPVYCDNRLTIAYPPVRRAIAAGFEQTIADRGYTPDVIAGTATAGIPHAAWLAERLDLPLAYVRSASKGHGKARRVEGRIESGARVVLVEDLVSTGMSSLDAVEALRTDGAEVVAVIAIFTYGLRRAAEAFQDAGVALHTLTSFKVLLEVAQSSDRIDAETARALASWRSDPAAWSEAFEA